jgi:hypothetical protein
VFLNGWPPAAILVRRGRKSGTEGGSVVMTSKFRVTAACVPRQAAGLILACIATSAAAETCWTGRQGQYFNSIQYCVSSVLAPQAGNTYGPEHLAGWDTDKSGAWCEGARGPGIGETITIRIEGGPDFRRLLVGNGYNKSPASYDNNGRVNTLEITTDTGIRTRVDLADLNEVTPVDLPGAAHGWVRAKILDVYPGAKFSDTCLSFLMPDLEHEDVKPEEQQPAAPGPAAWPPEAPPPTVLQPDVDVQ